MRLLQPLLALALGAVLAASAFASRERPVIGLSLDTLKEERWQRDRDLFVAEAEKLGATVVVQSANSDDTRQVRDIESLISRGVDVLVVVPHNGAALGRAAEPLEDLVEEALERPAEPEVPRARGRDRRVREAVQLARLDRVARDAHLHHAPARGAEVDGDVPARAAHA